MASWIHKVCRYLKCINSTGQLTDLHFLTQYLNGSFPNSNLLPIIKGLDDATFIGITNPARKKSERLNEICDYLM